MEEGRRGSCIHGPQHNPTYDQAGPFFSATSEHCSGSESVVIPVPPLLFDPGLTLLLDAGLQSSK